ncbi:MAG: tRNA (adenosine(37)-N6)-threonylcarbamoyltransferase complex ATPase subunit type 1 TsaE [Fimbriimonadaceae bacterium]|nr:tRNA (adenosine(37)-N6)-threonylcarbamoyltransferase complex ATPase subunit type 1 TsaE [Chthonomonadaceae bacterium]MCO5298189.1 tRNA (adenosine(37)-N6)-threonylcarbamoyltransferase complex ATPase subunit type 1 TsaE [Fimbriimonadaceae bacterium]
MSRQEFLPDEAATRALGARLAARWRAGDVVLLEGPLGAGKTTLVRGVLEALGHADSVRSPTFNLLQTFATAPPVMHADLYRVSTWQGIGLEEYLDTHLCLIEWPDRAEGLLPKEACWRVRLDFAGEGRSAKVREPG